MTWLLLALLWNPDAQSLWQEANQAYQDGRYADAVSRYERLDEQGIRDGQLSYNLANAYLKSGELGKAILHYHRAQLLLPGDADVRHNLNLANQQRPDAAAMEGENGTPPLLQSVLDGAGYRLVFFGALGALILAGLASLLILFRPQWRRSLGYVLVAGGGAGLCLLALSFVQHHQLTRTDYAIVLSQVVDVRSGPTPKEPINFTVHEGLRCQILEQRPGWYRIRLANGFNGWVPRTAIEVI